MLLRVAVTITKKADRWFISFKIETEPQVTEKSVDVVGVDLAVKSRFFTLNWRGILWCQIL